MTAATIAALAVTLVAMGITTVVTIRRGNATWDHLAHPGSCGQRHCACLDTTWPSLPAVADTANEPAPERDTLGLDVLVSGGGDDGPATAPTPMGPADDHKPPQPPAPVGRRYVVHTRRPPAGRP